MIILVENLGDCIHRMGTQPENWLCLLSIEVPFEVDVGLVTNVAYIPWPYPYHLPWQVQKKWLYQNLDSSNPGLNNTWSSFLHKHIVLIYMCVSCGECFMESGRFPINWRSMLHILLHVLIYMVIYIPFSFKKDNMCSLKMCWARTILALRSGQQLKLEREPGTCLPVPQMLQSNQSWL